MEKENSYKPHQLMLIPQLLVLFSLAKIERKNRRQLPAWHTKVVHQSLVDKGTAKVKKGYRRYEGSQSKPLGSCQLDECKSQPMRRKELRIGTWNVTGLANREVELQDAMVAYKLDVLGVSETWLKKGEVVNIPGYKWVGEAGDNKSGRGGGVGFLVKDEVWQCVGTVEVVNSRVIGMLLKVGNKECWMLQVYAPINDAKKEDKDWFWERLRDEVETKKRKAAVIMLSDVNG